MKRFSAIFLACVITSAAAAAEEIPLARISDYLNDLTTAKAAFVQTNDDGSRSTGTLYIKRPGRVRFEYDPPERALVVAGGGAVVIFDPKSNQAPETYPIKRTPLSIILDERVDLNRARMVVAHRSDGSSTIVTAQDPENPDSGRIDLYFAGDPVMLQKWVITDNAGGRTAIRLDALQEGIRLPDTLFNNQTVGESPGR
jgi:outer membrane lipoprotein-sorting protein